MYYLYFIGILCVITGLCFLFLMKSDMFRFIGINSINSLYCGYFLIIFGSCVVFSAKLASVFM
jgi:hypothetical protein